jgi:hypothetical protein
MKAAALVMLASCSFATARGPNADPARGCSRSSGYADFVIAAAGAALTTYSLVKYKIENCEGGDESGRCSGEIAYKAGAGFGVIIGVIELAQGLYGLGVASECEAAREKLTAAPLAR